LRFNSAFPFIVTAYDQGGLIFSGLVRPGDTFSFSGSQPTDKFLGPSILLRVAGSPNANIGTGCGSNVDVGDRFGNFTVVAGESKNGGPLCCHSSDIDNKAPDIDNCPSNRTVDLPASACTAAVTWNPPTADDDCAVVSLDSNYKPGDQFPVGSKDVIYTAKDKSGNTSTCRFTVTVIDVIRPEIINCPPSMNVAATSSCQAVVNWTPPTATDNCSGVTMTSTHKPGQSFPVGDWKVTYTAKDARGNTATCTFDIHVTDGAGPSFTGCPEPITVKSDEHGEAVVTWKEPQGTGCGRVSVERSHAPGSTFATGTTPVQYTFTDNGGRVATCAFDVTVLKPEIVVDIGKAVTPDGDGIHDHWELTNIEKYRDNAVLIIDRWGNKIFEARGYDNVRVFWDGRTGQGGAKVPTGTYFYTVEVRVQNTVWFRKGSLEVIQ